MYIGDVFASRANGFGEIGFFDTHVKKIGHGGDRWAAHGFADFNALGNGAGPPLFVAVQGFDNQATAARLGMWCDVSLEYFDEEIFFKRGCAVQGREVGYAFTSAHFDADKRWKNYTDTADFSTQGQGVVNRLYGGAAFLGTRVEQAIAASSRANIGHDTRRVCRCFDFICKICGAAIGDFYAGKAQFFERLEFLHQGVARCHGFA